MADEVGIEDAIAKMQHYEDIGNTEKADLWRKALIDGGYEAEVQGAAAIPKVKESPPFLDTWGRTIAETGGALSGGALGIPAGPAGVMLGAGLGGETAGSIYDQITEYGGGEVPERDLKDTMMGVAFNSMGGPMGRVPKISTLDDIVNPITHPPKQPKPLMSIDKAEELVGTNLSAGQKHGGSLGVLEAGAEGLSGSRGTMLNQRTGLLDDVDNYINKMFPQARSREVAGEHLREGVMDFNTAKRSKEKDMFSRVDDELAASGNSVTSRISIDELGGLSDEWHQLIKQDKEFAKMVYNDPDILAAINATDAFAARRLQVEELIAGGMDPAQATAQIAETGPLLPTYEVIKKLRTKIGEKMDDAFVTVTGGSRQALSKLYRTLSTDLSNGVEELGGKSAAHARTRANQLTKGLSGRLEKVDPIFKNVDNPSDIYERLSQALIKNPSMARAAKKSMPSDEWDKFVDTYVHRNTRGKAGMQDVSGELFSPSTTMTQLSQLKTQSPEGYKLLIEGKEKAIGAIEALSDRAKQAEKLRNHSNTAGTAQAQGMLTLGTAAGGGGAVGLAMTGNPITALGAGLAAPAVSIVTPYLISKVLSSKVFAKVVDKVIAGRQGFLPEGRELLVALSAAGADQVDVQALAELMGEETNAPLKRGETRGVY